MRVREVPKELREADEGLFESASAALRVSESCQGAQDP